MKARLALAAVSLLVTLLLGEVALRLSGYYGVRGAQIEKLQLVDDPVVDYRRIPNLSWIHDGRLYSINSQGWRDTEHTLDKPEGTYRILSIGDSVTNGHGIAFEEIYTKQLEANLDASPDRQHDFEVILITQGALNTEQEAYLAETEGLLYDPDLIVVGYVLNDPAEGASLRRDQERAQRATLLERVKEQAQRSSLVHLAYRSGQRLAWRLRRARGTAEVAAYATDDTFLRLHRNPKAWQRVVNGFDRLDRISTSTGIPVLVVIFPVLHDLESYAWLEVHEQVSAAAHEHGFHVLDLLPVYRGVAEGELQFVEGDHIHPGAKGHRLAAEAIETYLDQRLWSSPPTKPRPIPTPASTDR